MKKFKITEEQIKENQDLTLKEYFKEVFETKLEVGKWYKDNSEDSGLIFIEKYNGIHKGLTAYGFYWNTFDWSESSSGWCLNSKGDLVLATEEEVFNSLKKEAEKRGFVKGNKVKDNGLEFSCKQNEILKDNTFDFDSQFNQMWMKVGESNYNCFIFDNGKWAEIISQPEEVIELNGVKYKRID